MSKIPKIFPGDWIAIGEQGLIEAVVVHDLSEKLSSDKKSIYCIYLDGKRRVLYGELEWEQNYWRFSGCPGDYADNIEGLANYINILKTGR